MTRPCHDYAPKSSAFEEGYRAFDACVERLHCPYQDGTEEADEWYAGWDQAELVDYERRCGEGQP